MAKTYQNTIRERLAARRAGLRPAGQFTGVTPVGQTTPSDQLTLASLTQGTGITVPPALSGTSLVTPAPAIPPAAIVASAVALLAVGGMFWWLTKT